jgi:hypothetical protein
LIRQPVESTNIASIGYDAEKRHLEVEFLDGSIYRYTGVSERRWRGLMAATSKGGYLHQHIVGVYQHERLRKAGDGSD